MDWHGFWYGAKELSVWAIILRAVILYLVLIYATKLMRKRQVAILSGHNYLVAAGIVSLAAVRMANPEASLEAGIAIVILYALINMFISFMDIKLPRYVDRHATILIEDGKLIKKNIRDARITIDNLMGQLRLKSIFSLSDVELAIIEPTGKINVVKKAKSMPVTRKHMKLPIQNVNMPIILIYDGKIQNQNLKKLGYDLKWLEGKLYEKGIPKPQDVFLATLEGNGAVHISVQ